MYQPLSEQALSWVAASCGASRASVVFTERLIGGITADIDRIVLRDSATRQRRLVLRRWTKTELSTDGLVEREASALRVLDGREVAAPRLLATDPTGAAAGVPSLLMSEVPGEVVLAPPDLAFWIDRLARMQARIHALPATLACPATGWFEPSADFGWITDTGLRRDAVDAASADLTDEEAVLAHGDYQHFNVLWNRGRITGVVDWTQAGTGPRGIDVGHCRLNLAVLFSAHAADLYLARYEHAAGVVVNPRADLRALLCWDPDWLDFIPIQVAGRAPLDLPGMSSRVVETVKGVLNRID